MSLLVVVVCRLGNEPWAYAPDSDTLYVACPRCKECKGRFMCRGEVHAERARNLPTPEASGSRPPSTKRAHAARAPRRR